MKQYFTIGETAQLNNISIQTLRYYDKLGIFEPHHTDPENGYRYYHIKQFLYLDIIKSLKCAQTPLEKIKEVILDNPEKMLSFLNEQERVIKSEIVKYEQARLLIEIRKNQLVEQLEICKKKEDGEVYSRYIKDQTIVQVAISEGNPYDSPDMFFHNLADLLQENCYVIDNQYGYSYDFKPYKDLHSINYSHFFTTISEEDSMNKIKENVVVSKISPGEYVCIAFDWSPKHYFEYYKKLYDYILFNNIQTEDKVYEVNLPINYSSSREERFLTELRIKKL